MKRIIIASALFSAMSMLAYDTRPFDKNDAAYTPNMAILEKKLQQTAKTVEEKRQLERQAEGKLLQTTRGKAYKDAEQDWFDCTGVMPLDSLICEEIHESQRFALAKLKMTKEYQDEYLPVINDKDYHHMTLAGLVHARNFAARRRFEFKSEKEAMLAGVDSLDENYYGKPSVSNLRTSNDADKITGQVKQELRQFIEQEISGKQYQ